MNCTPPGNVNNGRSPPYLTGKPFGMENPTRWLFTETDFGKHGFALRTNESRARNIYPIGLWHGLVVLCEKADLGIFSANRKSLLVASPTPWPMTTSPPFLIKQAIILGPQCIRGKYRQHLNTSHSLGQVMPLFSAINGLLKWVLLIILFKAESSSGYTGETCCLKSLWVFSVIRVLCSTWCACLTLINRTSKLEKKKKKRNSIGRYWYTNDQPQNYLLVHEDFYIWHFSWRSYLILEH